MKVYKITLCYIDFDGIASYGDDEIKTMIENARIPNHVSVGDIMKMESVEIGEWEDDNPLNNLTTREQEFNRLFPEGLK